MDRLHYDACPRSALVDPLARPDELLARLAQYGITVFSGIDDAAGLINLAQTIGVVLPHPDSDMHGVTVIAEREHSADGAVAAGFTRAALVPHTDRADMPLPPPVLVNLCTVQADAGGESTFVDGAAVHRLLAAQAAGALRALSQPRAVAYGRTHVYAGPVFEPTDDGQRLRLRIWPREAGRFSREAEAALDELQRAIAAQTLTLRLKAGQGYVIDNHRWLHGRLAYIGDRVVLRIGVAPHQRALLKTGIPNTPQQGALPQ
ncbi:MULTISPECIES: TauD/TfdA family dioxygenase [unclassified Streptomyces]|uniref:TauD/TfdA family dioxygenase n=1 Tax=unclassified Streptomyces TaxID=2593676 RepID=UPI003413F3D2